MKVLKYLTFLTIFILLAEEAHGQGFKPSVAGYVRRAEGYVNSGAWNSAKREIDEGLEIIPDDSDLRYLNGYYYYVIGDMNEARYNLTRAVMGNDDQVKAKRLLIDVEDHLQHYSSAICYINELLEIQPYDRDLWRRKIALYRKLNNDVEADAALQRLNHIFPNDTLVMADIRRRDMETRDNILRNSSLSEAATNLERWIDMDPNVRDYYLELVSVYAKMGDYDRALAAAKRGLEVFPNDQELINKAAGIMTELGYYSQAYAFIKDKRYGTNVYNNILSEMAADARMHDPYEANGRYYLATHDRDALNYLINTAMTRGYYDDARNYLAEAMKTDGRTPTLLMKLYTVERQAGNDSAANRLLTELYENAPDDEDLLESYTEMMLRLCDQDFAGEQWADAYQHLGRVLELIDETSEYWPSTVSRQILVLGRLNRLDEARELFEVSAAASPENQLRFASAYEELATARLKALMEDEHYEEAYREAEALLSAVPESESALRCLINMSQTLKLDEAFYKYAAMGYAAYPTVPYFIVKQAIALQEQGRNADALALLRPNPDKDVFVYEQVASTYTGISQDWANQLLKDNMPEAAMEVLDNALIYDPENRDLLYTKGLAYEKLKDYKQAYDLQHRYYNPSNAEQVEFLEHMSYLGMRSFKNRIEASYTHAFFDARDETLTTFAHLYSIASVTYTRIGKRQTFTGQINYKGIDGYRASEGDEPGGSGLEFMAQWEHEYRNGWSTSLSASISTRYFNRYGANFTVSRTTEKGWTSALRLGYRRTPPSYLYLGGDYLGMYTNGEYNVFIATPSIEKAWNRASLRLSTDLIGMQNSLYYNVGLKASFFFMDDDTSSISFLTGVGSFPELIFFEQTALRDISHTNVMLGFDARLLCTRQLAIGFTGTWNTCYNPNRQTDGTIVDSYKNIYALAIRAQIAF